LGASPAATACYLALPAVGSIEPLRVSPIR